MKKTLATIIAILGLAFIAYPVFGQTIPGVEQWSATGTLGNLVIYPTATTTKVIIGANSTSSPNANLQVTGNIYASGNITCGGTCGTGSGSGSTTLISTTPTPYLTVTQSGSNATLTLASVLSLSNNAAPGGINFTSATGTNIQAELNSLALSQFTGTLSVSNGGTGTTTLASLTSGSSPNLTVIGGQNVLIGTSTSISLGANVVTTLATGTAGNIFNGSIGSNTLTLNLPFASASNTGQLQSSDWTTFNNKENSFTVLPVTNGGTGAPSLTATDILFGNGTSPVATSSGFTFASNILTTPAITLSNLTGTQCLHEISGVVSGTGSDCGSGGGGGSSPFSTTTNVIYNNFGYTLDENTTTPAANLFVEGSSTAPTLNLFSVASSSGTKFLNVTPAGVVQISSGTPGDLLTIRNDINNQTSWSLQNFNTGANSYMLYKLSNGSSDTQFFKFGSGYSGSGSDKQDGTELKDTGAGGITLATVGSNSTSTINFYTDNGLQRMIVGETGLVGINTTTPANQLDVYASNNINPFNVSSSSNNSILQVLSSSGVLLSQNASSTNSSATVASSIPTLQLGSTALSAPSANGTFIGINSLSNFSGNFLQFQKNGTVEFSVSNAGSIVGAGATIGGATYGGTSINFNNNATLNVAGSPLFGINVNFGTLGTAANGIFGWSNTNFGGAQTSFTLDTGLSRLATSTIAVGNGTLGSATGTLIAGNIGIGTSTPNSTLDINGNVRFEGIASVVTPSIGGAIVGLGCDSATTSIDSTVSSSTAAFITTPQNYPGDGLNWFSYLSASGVITTKVCSDVTVTPATTQYVVKIIK